MVAPWSVAVWEVPLCPWVLMEGKVSLNEARVRSDPISPWSYPNKKNPDPAANPIARDRAKPLRPKNFGPSYILPVVEATRLEGEVAECQ
jgi:hypothetical protein